MVSWDGSAFDDPASFFAQMQKKAERTHSKKREPPHPDSLGAGGKSADGGGAGSKSSGSRANKK